MVVAVVSAEDREKNVNVVKGILRKSFHKRKQGDPSLSSWVTEFENLLMQSHTEQGLYDFKQGFMRVDGSRSFDESVFEKVFKTLSSMANQGPDAVGYVIVGVSMIIITEKLASLYGIKPVSYQRFMITGIEHEATNLPKKLDSYFLGITQRLNAVQMSQWAKDQIARDVRLISYFDKSLVVFKIEGENLTGASLAANTMNVTDETLRKYLNSNIFLFSAGSSQALNRRFTQSSEQPHS